MATLSRVILSFLNNERQLNFKYLGKKDHIRRVALTEWVVSTGVCAADRFQNRGREGSFPDFSNYIFSLFYHPSPHHPFLLITDNKRTQRKSSVREGKNEAIVETQGRLTGKYNSSSSGDLRFLMDVIWMPCVFWRKAGGGKMQVSSWEHFWSTSTFIKQTVASAKLWD